MTPASARSAKFSMRKNRFIRAAASPRHGASQNFFESGQKPKETCRNNFFLRKDLRQLQELERKNISFAASVLINSSDGMIPTRFKSSRSASQQVPIVR